MLGTENDTSLAVVSWNINSLGPRKNQMQFLSYFKKCCANIVVAVDTRLSKTSEDSFAKMWGGQIFFNSLCSNSIEIGILVKDGVVLNNVKLTNVIAGNLSKLKFTFRN